MRLTAKLVHVAAIVAAASGCGGAVAATASHDDGGTTEGGNPGDGGSGDASTGDVGSGGQDATAMDGEAGGCRGATPGCYGNDMSLCCGGWSGPASCVNGAWMCGASPAPGCDGTTCGTDDGGDACAPTTCASLGFNCGPVPDGCGGVISCGACTPPEVCGGGGSPNVCGGANCKTCASVGANCGTIDDGCGHTLDCGTCPSGLFCGWPGPNQCGCGCCPVSCAALGYTCGIAGDGCGGTINCGSCVYPEFCGGGGYNKCGGNGPPLDGSVLCTPWTCASLGYDCGPAADGCGEIISCGSCSAPQECGAGGAHYQCGNPDAGTCTPLTCTGQHFNCGPAGDGCGNEIMCGTCPPPATCGGGGIPNVCGP